MIGYYIHHHGTGHLARATSVAHAVSRFGRESVIALSSLPEPPLHPYADWVQLAPDPTIAEPEDATAGGALHWAPLDGADYGKRMAQLTRWAITARPRLVVVDVSVEVTVALRVLGVPVVVTAMPGMRQDDAHTLGYRLASAIVAPWSSDVYRPRHLDAFAAKTFYVGAFSRFDDAPPASDPTPGHALVLFGSGGGGPSQADLAAMSAHTTWTCGGSGGFGLPWSEDVWVHLSSAQTVITHAGQNILAEVAAARRASVVIAQDRPFGEQHATARALADAGIVTALDRWPEPQRWQQILDDTAARGGNQWKSWNDGAGASRFAKVLAAVRAS